MSAPVPIFTEDDWREKSGESLALVGMSDEVLSKSEFDSMIGLVYVAKEAGPDGKGGGKYVAPRVKALQEGRIRVEDLDDEELLRGQVKDADGKFRGGPSRKIPAEFYGELMRRVTEQGVDKLRAQYLNAIDVMTDIMNDPDEDGGLRLRAAQYVIERIAGKTPDKVEHSVEVKPWEVTLQAIIRERPDAATLEAAGANVELPSFVTDGMDFEDAELVDDNEDDNG